MSSTKLDQLYLQYDIANLPFGIVHDKLGDVYEDFCVYLLSNPHNLALAKDSLTENTLDFEVFSAIMNAYGIRNFSNISEIAATNKIPHRATHGLSKTDIIATIKYEDGACKELPMSCKQSTVAKVAFAEFDAETICREVGISDQTLKALILKHQTDKSAKNFTPDEKKAMRNSLAPIARQFVRWVITGSPDAHPSNTFFPTALIKFKTKKPKDRYNFNVASGDFQYQSFKVYTIDEYIDATMLNKDGTLKSGGFGTGLSWTYATGSGGVKIQFKA